MNILLIGINYAPEDTAIGLYSSQMCEWLAKNHHVEVITTYPYYPNWKVWDEYKKHPFYSKEKINGVTVYRSKCYVPSKPTFSKRIVHLMSFVFGAIFNLFKTKSPDVVIVVTPFIGSLLLAWYYKIFKKSVVWVHVQDFEFEAALDSGLLKNNKFFKKSLLRIEKILFSIANYGSTISYAMMDKLKRKLPNKKIYYFPNWIDLNFINPEKANHHPYFSKDKINILYSGNIGQKQDWDTFEKVLSEAQKHKNLHFTLVGDGATKEQVLASCSKYTNFTYHTPIEYKDLPNLLCSADLHILFQKTEVIDTVMPSKLLGMMASGKPSLVVGNPLSEVKQVMDKAQAGIYTDETNAKELVEKIISLSNQSASHWQKARDYATQNFSYEIVLQGFEKEISVINTNMN